MPTKKQGNYLRLYRSTLASDLYKCAPVVRELWFWLLMRANWTNSDKAQRGQWIGTIDEIRDELSWYSGYRKEKYSRAKIVRAYGKLTELRMVETLGEKKGISIKVCNYGTYQSPALDQSETTGETIVKHQRNDSGRPYYIKDNIKLEVNNIEQERYKKEYTKESIPISAKILRIVKPVFGDLVDPISGLGGLSKWGPIVHRAIHTYTEQAVTNACHTLVELQKLGEANYSNPLVFFESGLPGYIVKSQKKKEAKLESGKWLGFCLSCEHQKEYPKPPKSGNFYLCEQCGEDSYVDEWMFKHEKNRNNGKVIEKKKRLPSSPDANPEDVERVKGFLDSFGS